MSPKQKFAMARGPQSTTATAAPRQSSGSVRTERQKHDKWERQANEAADCILRGERNVARMLTPAPAASYRVASSVGQPLPLQVRVGLESAFGADLSAVRIHRDAAAASAARHEHAFAFASGRDIYFDEGRYDFSDGRRLLLHEMAHVLQQTGRASSGGELSATVQNSAGGIQCSTEIPDFAALRKLHSSGKKGAPEDPKFANVADELAKRVAVGAPVSALEEYFRESFEKIKDWPAEAESLFYDTLKRSQRFDLAAQLIERDDFKGGVRIRTAGWSDGLLPALERRKHGSAVYALAAEKHPALAFYTKELARLVEVFIFQPVEAEVPEMRRFDVKEGDTNAKTIEDHTVELSKRLDDNTKLSSSEWVYRALYTINRLNKLRKDKCVEIGDKAAKAAAKTNELHIFRKRRYAEGVRDWGDNFLASTKDVFADGDQQTQEQHKTAWEPFLKQLGAQIAKVGRAALDIWDRKSAIDDSLAAYIRVPAGDTEGEARAVRGLAQVMESGRKSGLPRELISVLTELNRHDAGKESPPPAPEYSARSLRLANKLAEFSAEKLEKQQPGLFRQKKTEEVVAVIWLSIWVRQTASHLAWMAQDPNVGLPDERIAQRIRFAQRIKSLARPLAWTDVVGTADVILKAKAEDSSQLAILPYPDGKFWRQEERAPIEGLAKITYIKGWEPLTGEHLALLYQKDYYDTLAQKIVELAPFSDTREQELVQSGGLVPFVAGRANEEVRKLAHPERWKVNSFEVALKEDSKESVAQLISRHPSFKEIVDHGRQKGLDWILPVEGAAPADRAEVHVWVWFIPPLETVLPTLHEIDLLNAQVAAQLPGKEKPEKKLEQARKLDDSKWFQMLVKYLSRQLKEGKMSKSELQALRAALQHALEEKQNESWVNLLEQIKKGSRLDRQLIANMSRSHLVKYENDHNLLNQPMEALEPIIRFFAAVSMLADADVDAEMTALMLDLAPTLSSALGHEDRFDVVYGYLGFLESALTNLPTFLALSPKARHAFLPDYQNTTDWINPRVAALKDITKWFQEVRATIQQRRGYKTSVAAQAMREFMAFSSGIPVGTILYPRAGESILGEPIATHYQVTKVLRDYIFHPAYGYSVEGTPDKTKKKVAASGYSAAKFFEVDDKTPLVLKPGEKLLEVRILNRKDQQVDLRQVGDGPEDAQIMADIDNGLSWAAFGSAMGNINAGIEWYVNTMLDLAEFIPGIGQGIAAARILATITDFWASGDYKDVMSFVSGEIRNIIESLLERIQQAADPENLVQLLLFGDPRLDELLAHINAGKGGEPVKSDKAKKPGRIATVINAFRRLGHGLFHALRLLRKWIQVPMQDVRAFVTSRPLLSLAVQFIADHIFTLAKLAKAGLSFFNIGEKKDREKGAAEELKKTLQEEQAEFGPHVHGILKQLEELKLPQTILHIEPIIAGIFGMLEGFIVGRLGMKARIVLFGLKNTGALAFFNDRIANEIVQRGGDPNIYWREQIVPQVAGRFNETREDVVRKINGVLGSEIFGGAFQPIPEAEKLTLQPEGEPFEETQETYVEPAPEAGAEAEPYPSPDRPLRPRPPGVANYGPGLPLNPMLRRRVEAVFNQDFRHVRLHRGAESTKMTDAFGVDGLATGSHIFLRSGLSPESGQGSEVFYHELAHVLEQTGGRPPGGEANTQPMAGHPELGLDYSPVREHMADRLAALVHQGSRPTSPVMTPGQGAGFQPAGLKLSTVSNLLGAFTNLDAIKLAEETIDKISDPAKEATGKRLPPKARSTVANVLAALMHLNDKTKAGTVKYPGVFTQAVPLIENRLNNATYAEPIRLAAYEIARQALPDLPVPVAPKGAKGTATNAEPRLKPVHFARLLEEFILAKTGIVLSLKLKHIQVVGSSGKEETTVDDQNPVQQIKILHVYLPYIDGRSPLWQEAIKNTWKEVTDEKELDRIRIQARAHFARLGIVAGVWALIGEEYRFSWLFKTAVNELVKASKYGPQLDPKDLPSPREYALADMKMTKSPIGVRVATYDDPSQKGAGRQSHHLTQFLLADYFANANKSNQPFSAGRNYPGVTWKGKEVDLISPAPNAGADASIQASKTKAPTRGENMPAISLAASTHQNANLHLTTEPDDPPTGIKKVHGDWVDEKFTSKVPSALQKSASDATYRSYRTTHADAEIAQKIYDATQFTYREVVKRMSAKLEARMAVSEVDYYAEMAKGTAYDLRDKTNPNQMTSEADTLKKELQAVTGVAKNRNREIMRDSFGWKA